MNTRSRWKTANVFWPYHKPSQLTGWLGRLYRFVGRIGPVTRSSPVRRGIQIGCVTAYLFAFFYMCWPYAEHFSRTTLPERSAFPPDLFLLIDPLVGISTLVAARVFHGPTVVWAAAILLTCALVPRMFCGYICPLGTLIDAFDWLVGRHFARWHVTTNGPKGGWVHTKYVLLVLVLATSLGGVLSAGFLAAIPVLTRGLLFSGGHLQLGLIKGRGQIPPFHSAVYVSLALFAVVFLVSLFGRRFWCRYLCPSGALLSAWNVLRVGQRQVAESCISCNRCVEICPFDAIKEDFTTRTADCTFCQSCGGVCPTEAIQFVTRWGRSELKTDGEPKVEPRPVSRRAFVFAAATGVAAATSIRFARDASGDVRVPVRPPGSVEEQSFLDLCIRCGECFKVCPGPVLHSAGWEYGFESLWTPVVHPEHAGCHQECNFCTLVCPTGAIRPLELETKRKTHIGLAVVDRRACLPYRADGPEECDLCLVECQQAGYHAIEMRPIQLPVDRDELEANGFSDMEIEQMSTILAPVVDRKKCVGCGICTYRCHTRYVKQSKKLLQSAITVVPLQEAPQ